MALHLLASAPNDFDFVMGDWLVKHSRLKERLLNCVDWLKFDGEMSTQKILGGFGNLEDNVLYLPEGECRAIALRSFNVATGQWSIWWLDGSFPDQLDVPVVGAFQDGVGTFYANDTLRGLAVKVRFLWSQTNVDQLRWEQAFSIDDGLTWETNWTMDFHRKHV